MESKFSLELDMKPFASECDDQKDADLIEQNLKSAFMDDAYGKLKEIRWTEESVNVYGNNMDN